jgi:transposase
MHRRGIEELRQRFVEEGFESTLEGKLRGHRPRVLTGEDEARLITLVCGPIPEGCARWTLQLLEDAWVTLEHTDAKTVSRETIRRTLKKTRLIPLAKPGMVYSPGSECRVCSLYGGCP